jgi:ribonuclease E
MANKMLIDASHPEETRVVVVRGNRVEEFDFESANKKQLRGNIYLAKVTRVEPSLQAAFVDYGGNRHGFLAFSEIHPDYYQIPVADRQALLEEDARADREGEFDDDGAERRRNRRNRRNGRGGEARARSAQNADTLSEDAATEEGADNENITEAIVADAIEAGDALAPAEIDAPSSGESAVANAETGANPETHAAESMHDAGHDETAHHNEAQHDDAHHDDAHHDEAHAGSAEGGNGELTEIERSEEDNTVEQIGGGDAMEDIPERPRYARKQYKIQEVIKRRQILLIQVVKEERGNKGAALTTYLSLAGRYSVLMPNTGRGGGISRKITNAVDRKRLKEVAGELEVPDGMGVILRTAGASRTKAEIKRDFEYLLRLWETVREHTLQSTAPALVYEEGSLVKRAIRDLYNKDIDEVLVSGENAYREAKEFMRMLMPSHAKNVKPYRESQPLFPRYGVEGQLDAMFSNQVTLKSGGYLVINQTEALVAIDVNSGRATREHNIEDTALKTNCEAADEVARQLRLRDLAGLIVIDFIDMEEHRNNRTVERRLKEALKNDRARIQVGRISPFGLLEMSRQRIRTGVVEGSSVQCPHCLGIGYVRSVPSIALHVLRAIEENLIKSNSHHLVVRTRTEVALYILNQKRSHLRGLEDRFNVNITILADEGQSGTHAFAIEKGEQVQPHEIRQNATVKVDSIVMPEEPEDEDIVEEIDEEAEAEEERRSERGERGERGEREDTNGRRRRRRRRRGGERERNGEPSEMVAVGDMPMPLDAPQPDIDVAPFSGERVDQVEVTDEKDEEGRERGRRRRGRRGGRRNRRERDENGNLLPETEGDGDGETEATEVAADIAEARSATAEPGAPKVRVIDIVEPAPAAPVHAAPAKAEAPADVETPAPAPEPEPITTEPVVVGDPSKPKKGGWWARAKAGLTGQ